MIQMEIEIQTDPALAHGGCRARVPLPLDCATIEVRVCALCASRRRWRVFERASVVCCAVLNLYSVQNRLNHTGRRAHPRGKKLTYSQAKMRLFETTVAAAALILAGM